MSSRTWFVGLTLIGVASIVGSGCDMQSAAETCTAASNHLNQCWRGPTPEFFQRCDAQDLARANTTWQMTCGEIEAAVTSKKADGWFSDLDNNDAPAPDRWVSMPGSHTPQHRIDWLYNWFLDDTYHTLDDLLYGVAERLSYPLSPGHERFIAHQCAPHPSCEERILCVGREVRMYLKHDSTAVCRHHALASKQILTRLEMPIDIDGADRPTGGHAWNSGFCNGRLIVFDAYNDIYIRVKRPFGFDD